MVCVPGKHLVAVTFVFLLTGLDSASSNGRCQTTDGWFNFNPYRSYCLTNEEFNYEESVKECDSTSAMLVDLTLLGLNNIYHILSNLGIGENAMLNVWTERHSAVNGCQTTTDYPGCVFTFDGPRNFTIVPASLLSTHRALCYRFQNIATTTTTTRPKVLSVSISNPSTQPYDSYFAPESATHLTSYKDQNWHWTNEEEYLISFVPRTYLNSSIFCENMKAALMSFLNPMQYFDIMLQLNARNDSFWIGDGEHNSILMSMCTEEKACICSRHENSLAVVEKPDFKQMLQEMTVNKTETAKTVRSLNSAEDMRRSAQTAGLISASILCTFGAIIVLMDCSRLAYFARIGTDA